VLAARSSIAPAVDLDVDLDVFVGPFDLLVTLILKDEVDLWEVRVSRIIAEYVVRLADTGQFDLESTSQFVVLIAALLEMKSRLLAEDEVREELDEPDAAEAGEELLAAVVRYSQYKGAAATLRELWCEHADRMYRHVALPSRYAPVDDVGTVLSPELLVRGLAPLLAEPAVPDASHIADLAVTLVRELRRLRALLADNGPLTFAAVAPRDRLEKAITFFALLELHSRGEVTLQQRHAFGEIKITPLGTRRPPVEAVG
jgi:segregation and condensation protein A